MLKYYVSQSRKGNVFRLFKNIYSCSLISYVRMSACPSECLDCQTPVTQLTNLTHKQMIKSKPYLSRRWILTKNTKIALKKNWERYNQVLRLSNTRCSAKGRSRETEICKQHCDLFREYEAPPTSGYII